MTIWVDAQLSPAIATWISSNYAVSAAAIRDLGLRDAKDKEIFEAARQAKAVVMTKDSDFVLLLDKLGAPPQVIWVTCGNTSNARLKEILTNTLAQQYRQRAGEFVLSNRWSLTTLISSPEEWHLRFQVLVRVPQGRSVF